MCAYGPMRIFPAYLSPFGSGVTWMSSTLSSRSTVTLMGSPGCEPTAFLSVSQSPTGTSSTFTMWSPSRMSADRAGPSVAIETRMLVSSTTLWPAM